MYTVDTAIEYRTPVGTFSNWMEAADACERCDFDPVECITIVRHRLMNTGDVLTD